MDFIEEVRIGQERAETGLRAQIDRSPSIPGTGKVGGVGVAKQPAAQSDESNVLLLS
jgi:hypothetical protein